MKRRTGIIVMVIASIVLLGIIFGTIDYIRVKYNKLPIFVIYSNTKDTFNEYYGLGYKVVTNDDCKDYIEFGPYFGTYACFIGSNYINSVEVVKDEECGDKTSLYYKEENRKIYTYCLSIINVSTDNKVMELKDYLKTDSNTIEFIIDNFTKEPKASYDDGGTKLYHGDNFNILKCHTLNGNNDIYIGTKNMGYPNGFCQ